MGIETCSLEEYYSMYSARRHGLSGLSVSRNMAFLRHDLCGSLKNVLSRRGHVSACLFSPTRSGDKVVKDEAS